MEALLRAERPRAVRDPSSASGRRRMPHFAEPAYLPGLLAAGVPLAAALWPRRRATDRPSPPRARAELLLAALFLALLALAFARPERTTTAAPRTTILVLDRAPGLTRLVGGVSLLDRARAEACQALAALPPEALAGIVVTPGRAPEPGAAEPPAAALVGFPLRDRAALEAELRALEPGTAEADLPAALRLAAELARSAPDAGGPAADGPVRLVVFSDGRRAAWGAAAPGWLPAGVELTLVDVGSPAPPPANVALTSLEPFPARPLAGETFELRARAVNYGAAPAARRVRLSTDGWLTEAELELAPGEARTVALAVPGRPPGALDCRVELLPGDEAPADDRLELGLTLPAPLRVVLISRADPAAPFDPDGGLSELSDERRAGCALAAALAAAGGGTGVTVERLDPTALNEAGAAGASRLAGADAVCLAAGGEALDATGLGRLKAYLERGGGVGFFLVDEADVRGLRGLLAEGAAGAPGAAAGPRLELPAPGEALRHYGDPGVLRFGAADLDDPLLAAFREPAAAGLLRQASCRSAMALVAPTPGAGTPLLFANGLVALARLRQGRGRLLVANLGKLNRDSPVLPLLVRGLLDELARGDGATAAVPAAAEAAASRPGRFAAGELAARLRAPGEPRRCVRVAAGGVAALGGPGPELGWWLLVAAGATFLVFLGVEALRSRDAAAAAAPPEEARR